MNKLIKITEDYYIIVSDEEIMPGEIGFSESQGDCFFTCKTNLSNDHHYIDTEDDVWYHDFFGNFCWKVIYSTNEKHVHEGRVNYLSLERVKEMIDAESDKSIWNKAYKCLFTNWDSRDELSEKDMQKLHAFHDGYDKALEDNKLKKFTYQELLIFMGAFAVHVRNVISGPVDGRDLARHYLDKHLRENKEWKLDENLNIK